MNNKESYRKPNALEAIVFICLIILFIACAIHQPATGTMFK